MNLHPIARYSRLRALLRESGPPVCKWHAAEPRPRVRGGHTLLATLVLAVVLAGCSAPGSSAVWRGTSPSVAPGVSPSEEGYLRGVKGRLVDSNGQPVKLVGVSWFGFETATCAPHGLAYRNWRGMLVQMRRVGFNVLRIPYSNTLLDGPCPPMGINYKQNPDLIGLQGLALMDKIVNGAGRVGLKVILDRHSASPESRNDDLWYTTAVPESRWISDWVMLARHYRGNRTVIAADLHNEPHGGATWGDGKATDWRQAAERAGNAVLAVNPHLLILVEGIQYYQNDQYWWGGQLMGAARYPVRLSHPDKLVYSPHDYGPSVSPEAWFSAPNYPSNLPAVWDEHWGNLTRQGTPLLVGEFSGKSVGDDPEGKWQRALVSYLDKRGIGSIYWSWNPDSTDTDGMLQHDWHSINKRELDVVLGRMPAPSPSSKPGAPPSPATGLRGNGGRAGR